MLREYELMKIQRLAARGNLALVLIHRLRFLSKTRAPNWAKSFTMDTTTITCRVSPNARRSEFSGWTMDEKGRPVLLIKLRAAPVEGAANKEFLRFLTEVLDCPKSQVTLLRGETSRLKVVEFPATAAERLPKRE